jgi:hypothetical protein
MDIEPEDSDDEDEAKSNVSIDSYEDGLVKEEEDEKPELL